MLSDSSVMIVSHHLGREGGTWRHHRRDSTRPLAAAQAGPCVRRGSWGTVPTGAVETPAGDPGCRPGATTLSSTLETTKRGPADHRRASRVVGGPLLRSA